MAWTVAQLWKAVGLAAEKRETDVEKCRRANKLYLDTMHKRSTKASHRQEAEDDAEYLAEHGDEGLRLGSPYSIHTKLKYWRGQFSITKGDASDDSARLWEDKVGTKFKEAGLPFGFFYPKPPI